MTPAELAKARLLDAWSQCERHLHHLDHALRSITPNLPMTAQAVGILSDDSVQDWDQLVLRFARLQDTLGARLFPAILDYLQEPFEDRPMLDKLHRLERLGYLPSVEQWQALRAIRNRFAHDYPQDDALKAAYLNEGVTAVEALRQVLERVGPLVSPLKV